MEVAMTGPPNRIVSSATEAAPKQHPKEERNLWIVTLYCVAGIVFFGVLAYYISNYFAR